MKAIVFGGSGFLGSHVADSLSDRGYEVILFDKTKSDYIKSNQKMIIGDILSQVDVEKAIEGVDYVYDFAGIANLDDASTKPLETIDLNIRGTCIIVEACIKEKVKRFVYASSFYVYSDKGGFYRCSKQAAELYIEEYARKSDIDFTILRYGSLYGTRTHGSNGVYDLLYGALFDSKIIYHGSGEELREYIHVKDAAELSVDILDAKYKNKYLILTGHEAIRVKDMICMIQEILHKPVEVEYRNQSSELHYHMTPYNFSPRQSYKLTNNCYRDIGQGLMECLKDMYQDKKEQNDELH